MVNFFRKAWRGEERLWKVWWFVGAPLGILNAAVSIWLNEASETNSGMSSLFPLIAWLILVAAYFAWCHMALWCAKNVEIKAWEYLAKFLIIMGLIRYFIELKNMFLS